MKTVTRTTIQQALEAVEDLDSEDQAALVEIVQKRLVERRRAEIAENARLTGQAFKEGRARYGNVNDLKRDLREEP
jgi:hypothetical protein